MAAWCIIVVSLPLFGKYMFPLKIWNNFQIKLLNISCILCLCVCVFPPGSPNVTYWLSASSLFISIILQISFSPSNPNTVIFLFQNASSGMISNYRLRRTPIPNENFWRSIKNNPSSLGRHQPIQGFDRPLSEERNDRSLDNTSFSEGFLGGSKRPWSCFVFPHLVAEKVSGTHFPKIVLTTNRTTPRSLPPLHLTPLLFLILLSL